MVFSSTVFMFLFLPLTYILYMLARRNSVRNILLIIASLLFYAYGEPLAVLLMLFSILFNYICGLFMCKERLKKPVLVLAVIVNIALLTTFKYLGFLVGTLNDLAGTSLPVPEIGLPIGISFFTFQALSYVIDAYKDPSLIEKKIFNICLYVSFFPQLIAGPIIKFSDVAQQIHRRTHTPEKTAYGIRRFITGLTKKLIVANNMAVIADGVFGLASQSLTLPAAWAGAVCYALQIYFDFSGYSDMAIGLGKMFGFDFKENFNYPFSAAGMTDFWRRWNISVSSWFKEYVYIPLGGNRKGKLRTCLNKCIVFFLTGLWHGANFTFIAWGLIHGAFLLLEQYEIIPAKKVKSIFGKTLIHVYTAMVILVTFVIFRADTLSQGITVISRMFAGSISASPEASAAVFSQFSPYVILVMALGIIFSLPVVRKANEKLSAKNMTAQANVISSAATLAMLALCVLSLATASYDPFIYFRF